MNSNLKRGEAVSLPGKSIKEDPGKQPDGTVKLDLKRSYSTVSDASTFHLYPLSCRHFWLLCQ